ncbi:MAG: HlyD family secretion protein [Planctomycetota bacterium]|jgi:multidrug resistance efflux pump
MTTEKSPGVTYDMRRQARGAEPPRKERRWLRKLIWAGSILFCLVAVVVAVWAYRSYTRVRAARATVNAERLEVAAPMTARLVEVCVKEEDRVSKGQVLGRLDDTEQQAALEAAQATTGIRESQHEEAKRLHESIKGRTEADIEYAKAGVEVAAAQVARTEADHKLRNQQLAEEIRQSGALCEEARAQLNWLRKGARKEDIGAAEARLEAAKARLALAELEVQQSQELVVEGIDSQYILEVRKTNLTTQQNAVREAALVLQRLKAGATPEEIKATEQALAAREAELALAQAGRLELDRLAADLAIRRANLHEAQAQLKQAEAQMTEVLLAETRVTTAGKELEKAEKEVEQCADALDKRQLKADVAGTVTRVFTKVGEICRAGEVSMIVTNDSKGQWVDAFVPQQDAWLIREGQRAKIKVPGPRRWLWWRGYVDAEVTRVALHTQSKDGGGDNPTEGSPGVRGEVVWVKLVPLEPFPDDALPGMTARAYIRVR